MEASEKAVTHSENIPDLRFSIEDNLAHIRLVSTSVRSLVTELDLKEGNPGGVELALVELMTNCITHSANSHSKKEFIVEYQLLDDQLLLRTIDRGNEVPLETQKQINNPEIAMQNLPVEVTMLPESGWGLSLMKSLSQSLSYERIGDSNVFTLTFALN